MLDSLFNSVGLAVVVLVGGNSVTNGAPDSRASSFAGAGGVLEVSLSLA